MALIKIKNLYVSGRSRTLLYTKQIMEKELQQYGEELLQEFEGLMDHDYSNVQMPSYRKEQFDNKMSKNNILFELVGETFGSGNDININPTLKYIEPPLDDYWPPPKPGGLSETKVVNKLEVLTNKLKINISDTEGIRNVFVNVPQE